MNSPQSYVWQEFLKTTSDKNVEMIAILVTLKTIFTHLESVRMRTCARSHMDELLLECTCYCVRNGS